MSTLTNKIDLCNVTLTDENAKSTGLRCNWLISDWLNKKNTTTVGKTRTGWEGVKGLTWVTAVMGTRRWRVGVALGCRASAIIYQNTRVYGNYQLIIAIKASTRQSTVQPNATSSDEGDGVMRVDWAREWRRWRRWQGWRGDEGESWRRRNWNLVGSFVTCATSATVSLHTVMP